MTELIVNIPDRLAMEAQSAGLLSSDAIEELIREGLRRRAIDELFSTTQQLASENFPVMSMEEIQAEINAVRQTK